VLVFSFSARFLTNDSYTAYALNDDGQWYLYDDSRVTSDVDPKDVVSASAYVLYYRRRDVPINEEFVVNLQTASLQTATLQTPAIVDPLDKIGASSDDASSNSNAAMVDEDEAMDVDDDDTDMGSRATSPMGSIDGTGDQFDDNEFDSSAGDGRDKKQRGNLPLQ